MAAITVALRPGGGSLRLSHAGFGREIAIRSTT